MTQQHRPIATIVGPSLPAGRVSYRHRVGYRKFIAASLALIVVTLFASAPIASAAPGKTCMEIKGELLYVHYRCQKIDILLLCVNIAIYDTACVHFPHYPH